MEYQLYYGNGNLLLDESSDSKNSWEILSDSSADNENYFGWNGGEGKREGRKRKAETGATMSKMRKDAGQNQIIDDGQNEASKTTPNQNDSLMKLNTEWHEDMSNLNADIDSSLTSINQTSYNLNDTILSISGLNTAFKQEAPSPTSHDGFLVHKMPSPTSTQDIDRDPTDDSSNEQQMINSTINQLLNQSGYTNLQSLDVNLVASPTSSQDNFNVSSTNFNFGEDCRFQYVLAAATSIATKVNEDTLTYLNQGQSYEIKLKKLGDLSMYRGKMLKSVIRICFHERRLQYMEKEQMTLWQKARPGDRILDVDIPLSYGAFDIVQPTNALNLIHFNWDPTKEVGVYIMVNCISTEFTPKKHGGEKGVPFRIQVETYNTDSLEPSKRLHAAACQIKVFKLKGADRKHKQDREKIMKKPLLDQEKYQPSYDCTVLNDIPNDAVLTSPPIAPISPVESASPSEVNQVSNQLVSATIKAVPPAVPSVPLTTVPLPTNRNVTRSENTPVQSQINPNSGPEEIASWLVANRFQKYVETFSNFSGSDMLRLSRNDLIQMCGQSDGIRLFNALHSKLIRPKLKLYVSQDSSNVFNALYLSAYSSEELLIKLSAIVKVSTSQIRGLYLEGPNYIQIHLTDEVVGNLKDEGTFSLNILTENNGYLFLLKQMEK